MMSNKQPPSLNSEKNSNDSSRPLLFQGLILLPALNKISVKLVSVTWDTYHVPQSEPTFYSYGNEQWC